MVFTRKDGDFHWRTVSFREGKGDMNEPLGEIFQPCFPKNFHENQTEVPFPTIKYQGLVALICWYLMVAKVVLVVFLGGWKGKMLDQGIRIPAGGRVECLGFVVVSLGILFFWLCFFTLLA